MKFSVDKTFLPLILFLVLVIVLGFVLSKPASPKPTALKEVPVFTLPDLISGEAHTQKLLQGQWTLVNIWATWCAPCKQEHETLLHIAQTSKIHMVGINFKDDTEDAKLWLKDKGNPYDTVLADVSGRAVFDWGSVGVPETFLIDPQGVIRQRYAGILTKEIWQADFVPLMNDAPGGP